ncbi:recombinase family protein [Tsukamurella hominis]|uniref:recombinase family protein n=1 Tax=Tsukamurella hominis TaxID=1970232 RepID=UPI0039EAAA49
MYLRQSSDRMLDELGVDRQREAIEAFAQQRGWTIVQTYVDNDVSASTRTPRPAFEQMLADVPTGTFDVIVARHMDRLLRQIAELERVLETCAPSGVHVVTALDGVDTSTDGGRLVARILGSVAQGEVERKSARQRAAARQAAEQGRPLTGKRRFGFEKGGVEHRPEEAAAIRDAYAALLAGESQTVIARTLNEAGHRTGQNNVWDRNSVRDMLMNPANAGLRRHRPSGEAGLFRVNPEPYIVGRGNWEPIVPEETYRAALRLFTDPTRRRAPKNAVALLTGVAVCHCGATVHTGGARREYRMYRCRDHAHLQRMAEPIEDYVQQVVVARLSRDDAVEVFAPEIDTADDAAEADTLRRRLQDVAEDYADGAMTRQQFRAASDRIKTRLDALEVRASAAIAHSTVAQLVTADDVGAAWFALSTSVRRGLIGELMRVQILGVGRGVRTFRPESVVIRWNVDECAVGG